jgi:hypothetical protein
MPNDVDDPSVTHALADGWANFSETVLPGISGSAHSEAHIALYFSAMYLQPNLSNITPRRPCHREASI